MFVEMKVLFSIFFCALVLLMSCDYNSEEELYPNTDCQTENMSLASDITPILDNYNCNGCHSSTSNSGDVDLEGYDNLKIWIDNGKLMGSIKHDGTASEMPKSNPKMADCDIDKVEAWISQGAKNN